MSRFKIDNIFPTSIVQVDESLTFTKKDCQDMIQDVDNMIERGEYTKKDGFPKYQTYITLFNRNSHPVWDKLKFSFINACKIYLSEVPNFMQNQNNFKYIDSHAWCYKSWKNVNTIYDNPWHNHTPSILSGIFYLKVPEGISDGGGTEFGDPRTAEYFSKRNYLSKPLELSWCIFPGWLTHRSCHNDVDDPRYVIAANGYFSPKHEIE